MTEPEIKVIEFDEWLRDDSDVAALVMRQWLEPVEGKDAVIFPPTYATPERVRDDDWTGYNLDRLENGLSVCQIDSVGSQANRMEPVFLREPYKRLVPEVFVEANSRTISLLEAGHRAADAVVRFSDLAPDLEAAFKAIRDGDASRIAKIAPTSLVFGAWDSRGTRVKLPRIVRSVIRAFKVRALHRSAQYIPAMDYVQDGLLDAAEGKQQQDAMSELGLSHAPAPWTHGGVLVDQEIRRDATLNLAALRALGAGHGDAMSVRRYILGLSLVVFTAPMETFLREGCQLVPDAARAATWTLVRNDGSRDDNFVVQHKTALEYAIAMAEAFGVGQPRRAKFNAASAREALGQSKEQRRSARRGKTSEAKPDSNA